MPLKRAAIPSLAIVLALTGCGGDKEGSAAPPDKGNAPRIDQIDTPVALSIYTGADDNGWKNMIEDPVRKKFPNVTLERQVQQKESIRNLVAAGNVPDIVELNKNSMLTEAIQLNLQYDMTEYIKKYNMDLNRFRPEVMDSVRSLSPRGEIYGIPSSVSAYGLIYNKDLFDRFGVAYPKDHMTWDDAIKLGRTMTRQEGGVQYRGLDIQYWGNLAYQLKLEVIGKDDKATVTSPQWQKVAQTYQQIYQIPGNNRELKWGINNSYDPFIKGEVAMLGIGVDGFISRSKDFQELKWDVVTLPTFPEAPNTDPNMDYKVFAISSASKHKEEAFKVIAHLVSDEVAAPLFRMGYPRAISNPELQKQYGADLSWLKGKNLGSLFKNKQTDPYVSPYFDNNVFLKSWDKIRNNASDVNTLLREAEEALNKRVGELKK